MSTPGEAWIVVRGVNADLDHDGAGWSSCVPMALDDSEGLAVGVVVIAVCFDEVMAMGALNEAIAARETYIEAINEAHRTYTENLKTRGTNVSPHRYGKAYVAAVDAIPHSPRDPTLDRNNALEARYLILGPGPVYKAT